MMNLFTSFVQSSLDASALSLRQMSRFMEPNSTDSNQSLAFVSLNSMDQLAEALCRLTPVSETRIPMLELKNKLKAFSLFQYVDSMLEVTPDDMMGLREYVEKARRLGPFSAPWAWEGLGHYFTRVKWKRDFLPEGLLCTGETGDLPDDCLMPLHVGMGLVFAERLLQELGPTVTDHEIKECLLRFLSLCRANGLPSCQAGAIESLGLVAINLHPHLVSGIARQMAEMDSDLSALFWHGLGRGSYFKVSNALPMSDGPWRAWEMCRCLAPDENALQNAHAGLVWALTLVNLKHPEILVHFLKRHVRKPAADAAIINGVTSALMIWQDCAGQDPALPDFLQYQTTLPSWEVLVAEPSRRALQSDYPRLKQNKHLAEVFRFRSA